MAEIAMIFPRLGQSVTLMNEVQGYLDNNFRLARLVRCYFKRPGQSGIPCADHRILPRICQNE